MLLKYSAEYFNNNKNNRISRQIKSDRARETYWVRDDDDWVLKLDRRKLGRVFRDSKYRHMWRSRRADGRLSDMANLSWAKNAVLAAAERDIEPPKTPVKGTLFKSKSSLVRQTAEAAGL